MMSLMLFMGIGLKMSGMSESALAVLTNLFACWRSPISALLTVPAETETPAARSGRVLVANHWISPLSPRRIFTSDGSSFF